MDGADRIETKRLLLRGWRDADREPFARMNADPRVMEYQPALLTRPESDALVDRIEAHFAEHGFGLWAAELQATGEFVGYVGLAVPRFEAHFTPCVEIGWRLAAEYWGQGLATEGARAALRDGFDELGLNEIGAVTIEAASPLFFDSYRRNRSTGAFILIDPATNATAGAGMILERHNPEAAASIAKTALLEVGSGAVQVTPAERIARLGHQPATVWLTARIDLASLLERRLFDRGCLAQVLADRVESGILPELAEVLHRAGAIAICSAGAGMAEERERAKQYVGEHRFLEFDPESLPARDEAAADRIIRALEERAIIRPAAEFGAGEGI